VGYRAVHGSPFTKALRSNSCALIAFPPSTPVRETGRFCHPDYVSTSVGGLMKLAGEDRHAAFTMPEFLIVFACLVFMAALLLPNLARPPRVQKIYCRDNLKRIGMSFQTWALDNNDHYPMQVSTTNGGTMELTQSGIAYIHYQVMSNELSTPKVLICPEDKSRTNAASFKQMNNHNLSYFVGTDAQSAHPNAFLAGDDNLLVNGAAPGRRMLELTTNSLVTWTDSRHRRQGNLRLEDTSLLQLNNSQLREALAATGLSTNRLLMP
jgi:type II secretory pathway pseudopilin PulG